MSATHRRRPGGTPGAGRAASQPLALAAMMFAVAMTFIGQSIVSIAAPDIVSELGLSSSGMQWLIVFRATQGLGAALLLPEEPAPVSGADGR